ncbi:arylamine N-acetyltransferase family protein [Glycomyces buryatensis]|uniref:Arylamine N-acetyltransferase n=1 Tax=Glycomyces buryatensis TaxID=2570927 RepID=A0A4S8QK23_9ACTN|nr:arylamine N-acetyltransferase [Glycomyces buryatensis]THV41094.1 arylamine N-acetyltransferase [Glycomyces buryatensis]
MFDSSQLAAYLERIGLATPRRPTLHALRRLHRAHHDALPYENLDVQLGRRIRLDADSLFDKLVKRGRGGFCFEQNGLLAHVLEALGFDVRRVRGAVARKTEGDRNWLNHMPLLVRLREGEFLVDAGLGAGFADPLPLSEGSHRVGAFNFGLWRLDGGLWRCTLDPRIVDLSFDLDPAPRRAEDFAEKCLELETSPESGFVKTLTVQRSGLNSVTVLRARTLSVFDPTLPDGKSVHVLADQTEFAELLTVDFGLSLDLADLATLWSKAERQHENKLAEDARAPSAS